MSMTTEQVKKRSQEKLQQISDFMRALHLNPECKKRVDLRSGLIEDVVIFNDLEAYDIKDPEPVPTPETAPTGSTDPNA
jgi:hypothetical protein